MKKHKEAPKDKDASVVTTTEARQARPVGVIWVLVIGLLLAVIAGLALFLYF